MPLSSFIGHDSLPNLRSYIINATPSKFTFFEIIDSNESHHPTLPNKLPIAVECLDVADSMVSTYDYRTSVVLKRCEDHLLLLGFSNSDPLSSDLLALASKIGSPHFSKTILSSPLSRQEIKVSRFCPLLGRLYVHTRQRAINAHNAHNVYVLDYLAPPNY